MLIFDLYYDTITLICKNNIFLDCFASLAMTLIARKKTVVANVIARKDCTLAYRY
jgi:hypothetical protein